jgi:hypothetical protein
VQAQLLVLLLVLLLALLLALVLLVLLLVLLLLVLALVAAQDLAALEVVSPPQRQVSWAVSACPLSFVNCWRRGEITTW